MPENEFKVKDDSASTDKQDVDGLIAWENEEDWEGQNLQDAESYYQYLLAISEREGSVKPKFADTKDLRSTCRAFRLLYELADLGLIQSSFQITVITKPRTARYEDYLASPEWRGKAEAAKEAAGQRCQVCNASRDQSILDTHHRTYKRLGHEEPADLIVLCRSCHQLFHDNGKLAKPPGR